jgi:asparagine synthase (glutamine-hydrolysing)
LCGIAGFCNFNNNYTEDSSKWEQILFHMKDKLYHRGPDESGIYLSNHAAFSHARLSIIDLANGQQPMSRKIDEVTYTIVYNGEIYNTKELREDLELRGVTFKIQK